MKAKTTINFNEAQLETLRSLMLNVGWATPEEGTYNRINMYRTSEIEELAKNLSDLLDRADSLGVTVEGTIRR
jgi:hypothetical protein